MKQIEPFVLPCRKAVLCMLLEDLVIRAKCFVRDTRAIAASEVAMMLPVMLSLLLGIVDLGNGLLVDKKTSSASQMAADLLTRQPKVDDADIDDAYAAGRMAVQPYNSNMFGIDIVSIQFQGQNADPVILWRETFNMDPNDKAQELSEGLGATGEGVVVVTTQYNYVPFFTHSIVGDRLLQEVAITRPRRGSTITREN